MKKNILFACLSLVSIVVYGQEKIQTNEYESMRKELVDWDPIRGEWLSSSLIAMSKNEPIPDRTFPEEFTPGEMLRVVPDDRLANVQRIVSENQRNAAQTDQRTEWESIANMVARPNCKPVTGRSYGDPHLVSFDNASYSFQTVGEFVLVKSVSRNVEIQTRQQAQSDDFSLNTAVAMNVGGDRVAIYANEKPDNISSSALRVNGQPLTIRNEVHYLPHGGTIRYGANTYTITWPTGEVLKAQMRNSSRMNFLNLTVQVSPCAQNDLQGLLGNANGSQNDDFDVRGNSNRPMYMAFSSFGNENMQRASNEMEKEYLAFLARDFAQSFRVTNETTLFDYGMGMNTLAYTDLSFPKVHRTVGDLSNDRQINAQRRCEEQGIRGAELKGCIFDNAYLEIPPSPKPTITDPTSGVVLGKLDRPVINNNANPSSRFKPVPEVSNGKGEVMNENTAQPLSQPSQREESNIETRDGGVNARPNTPIQVIDSGANSKPSTTTTKPPVKVEKPSGSNSKPSGTTTIPSGGNSKPAGTVVNPSPTIKTSPTIKVGKG